MKSLSHINFGYVPQLMKMTHVFKGDGMLSSILKFLCRPLKEPILYADTNVLNIVAILVIVQCCPFETLCLGSIGMDIAISQWCYKGTILQKNYRKLISYKSCVKFHGEEI